MVDKKIDPNAAGRALSKLGASKGGEARAAKLTQAQRSDIARKAVQTRWAKKKGYVDPALSPEKAMLAETTKLPEAKYKGCLSLMNLEIPCYVLDTEERVIGRTATTEMLSGFKGQGDLEGYLRSQNLKPFINIEYVVANMVSFSLPEVEQLGRSVKGLPTDLLIEICRGLVQALEASQRDEVKLTPRQLSMSVQASMFLVACAKVGLDALVDEATGYQHDRAENALQVKLRAY